jgi:hypothetical protein
MRFVAVLVVVVAAALASPARAVADLSVSVPSVEDVLFPFGCDWGYDWDERCYRHRGERLVLGGVGDKVWRAGVRFDLAGLPRGSPVASTLWLWFDGTCAGVRGAVGPCPPRTFDILVHALRSADWFYEREPEYEQDAAAIATLEAGEGPQWIAFEVTAIVAEWLAGGVNDGALLRLDEAQETHEGGGPRFASTTEPDPALRPRLEVTPVPG